MARFNEILAGRFNRALQKFLGMKGGPPAPQLASEISTNFQFNQMGVDFRWLEGWERFWGVVAPGPVAAQNSAVQLRNPPNSGVMVVIEKLKWFVSVASGLAVSTQHGAGTLDLTNIAASDRLDSRGRTSSTLVISSFNNIVALPAQTQSYGSNAVNTAQDEIVHEDHQLIMLPGDAYRFTSFGVNLVLTMNFIWRERALEESETK